MYKKQNNTLSEQFQNPTERGKFIIPMTRMHDLSLSRICTSILKNKTGRDCIIIVACAIYKTKFIIYFNTFF